MTVRSGISVLLCVYLTLDSLAINELPFGALRKAQRTLDRTYNDSDDEEESDESDSTEGQRLDDEPDEESKGKVSAAKVSKRVSTTTARRSKHA
jgi:hypothetical protein